MVQEIAAISLEIKERIARVEVHQNEIADARFRGKPANIVWCHFGYSEDDIIDCNFVFNTTWVDDTQDKKWWYRESKNGIIIDNIYIQNNPSYEMVHHYYHDTETNRDPLIEKTRHITEEMVNTAQKTIALYHEYRNASLTEEQLVDALDPLIQIINRLFTQQSDLPYPPKELHEWMDAHTQLAGTIFDLSLFYNRRFMGKWDTQSRVFLMDSKIKQYAAELEALRQVEINI